MKGLLLLLLPSLSFAAGPIYQHKDDLDQQEFVNIYHDISDPVISSGRANTFSATSLSVSTITAVSSATITNLRVTSLSGLSLGKILQVQAGTSTSATATASGTFVDTALSVAITPSSASSKILIILSTDVNCTTTERLVYGISRDGTDLGTPAGFGEWAESSLNATVPLAIVYLDSPAKTTSTVYRGRIKNSIGSTVTDNPQNQTISIVAFEVGP
jgi:hypothetical protein